MPTRERARYAGRVVTVMEGDPTRKRGKIKIRDMGFVKEVSAKEVEPMQDDDPAGSTLKWRTPRGLEGFEPER